MLVRTIRSTQASLMKSYKSALVHNDDGITLIQLESQLERTRETQEKLRKMLERRLKISDYWGSVCKMTKKNQTLDIHQRDFYKWFADHRVMVENEIDIITNKMRGFNWMSDDMTLNTIQTSSPTLLRNSRPSAYFSRMSLVSAFQEADSEISDKSSLRKLQEQYENSRDAEDKLIVTINARLANLLQSQTMCQKKLGILPRLGDKMKSKDANDRNMAKWFRNHCHAIENKISIVGRDMPQTDFNVND